MGRSCDSANALLISRGSRMEPLVMGHCVLMKLDNGETKLCHKNLKLGLLKSGCYKF